MGHEHEPGVTAWIIGDGNSFFRKLSYFLTGTQRDHQCLRALLCQFMRENNEQFNAIANQKVYAIISKVPQLGEYVTEVEIFAAATFLGTPICTFSPYGDFHKSYQHTSFQHTLFIVDIVDSIHATSSNLKKIFIPYYVVIVDSTYIESTIASFGISFFHTSTFFGTVGLLH